MADMKKVYDIFIIINLYLDQLYDKYSCQKLNPIESSGQLAKT